MGQREYDARTCLSAVSNSGDYEGAGAGYMSPEQIVSDLYE